MKALVAGWFSFEQMGATAGDLLAREVVTTWLDEHGCPYDVALAPPFAGGVDWRSAEPAAYSHVVFVCGPFGNGPPLTEFLDRFGASALIGINLSMLQDLEEWNPFRLLLERDSSRTARPDAVFLSKAKAVPVIGRIRIQRQPEYRSRGRHEAANAAIDRVLASCEASLVDIDTRLDTNSTGLRTPAEIETLIARMDAVVTTRLHGLVFAIKNRVPALAIDPVAGGAKISRQAQSIGWPVIFTPEQLDDAALRQALDFCLTAEARRLAEECRARAILALDEVRPQLLASLDES